MVGGAAANAGQFSFNLGRAGYLTQPAFVRYSDGEASGWSEVVSSQTLAANTWSHVAITNDGTTYKYYVNGSLTGFSLTNVNDGKWFDDTTVAETDHSVIGRRWWNGGWGQAFQGLIDEFKIYNYPRSAAQISQDMNAGSAGASEPLPPAYAYWKFDTGSGDTLYDSGTGGNNGNLAGSGTTCPQSGDSACPTWTNDGKFNKALNFSTAGTTDDYVEIANESNFDLSSSFAISMWIKRSATGTVNQGLISKSTQNNSYGNFALFFDSTRDGYLICHFFENPGWIETQTGDASEDINDTNWHHIVCSYDFDTKTTNLWIDKKLVDSASWTTEAPQLNDHPVRLGVYTTTYYSYFNGLIDETKIYKQALTQSQVNTEFNQGKGAVFGASSTSSAGGADTSAAREYCVPGDSTSCSAPVGIWKFDEKTGTQAFDGSGNSYTGTLGGDGSGSDVPSWSSGKYGSSLLFDNTDDYVSMGNNLNFGDSADFTISGWFYRNSSTAADVIVAKKDGGAANQSGYMIQLSNTGRLEMYVSDVTDQLVVTAPLSTAVSTGRWYHFTAVYDDDSVSNTRLFLNGVDTNAVHSGTLANVNSLTNARPLTIGAASLPQLYFDGKIDHIAIYNYARTPAQIAWDYNQGKPIAWYKFDECQGSTANDSSGNGNTATIYPAAGTNTSVGTCSSGTNTEMWNNGASGKINSSLDFDGADDMVNAGDIPGSDSGNYLTVAYWVKPDTATTYDGHVAKWNYTPSNDFNSWAVRTQNSAADELFIFIADVSDPGSNYLQTTNLDLANNVWTHLAFVYDGTQANADRIKLYKNGVLVSGIINGTIPTSLNATTNDVTIGRSINSFAGQEYYSGQMDDVQIFNYALTPQQIKNLTNQNAAIRFGQ